MHSSLVFSVLLATSLARPDALLGSNEGHVSVIQNSEGTYRYSIKTKDSTKTEERFADGTVIGEYTVPNGKLGTKTFKYTSGPEGYRIVEEVTSSFDLIPGAPIAVQDTPEVKAAKEEFFAIQRAVAQRNHI